MKDVIIIGAGPCGLSAAVEAERRGLDSLVLEKGCIVNHITQFPTYVSLFGLPEDFEIGGVPFSLDYGAPRKKDAMRYYFKVVDHEKLKINQYEEVREVRRMRRGQDVWFEVISQRHGETSRYEAANVVFATGFLSHPRYLGIEGEHLPKVSHLFTEAHYFARQKVVVVGTGHSGLEAVMDLLTVGAEVTLVHRGTNLTYTPKRWMMAEVRKAIDSGLIKAYFNSRLSKITEDRVWIETLEQTIDMENDFVLKLIGFEPNYEPIRQLGVEFDAVSGMPVFNPETMETNVEGLYVCGVYAGGRDVNTITIPSGRLHGSSIMERVLAEKQRVRV